MTGIGFTFPIYIRTKKKKCYILTSVEKSEDLTNGNEMRQPKNRLGESHDDNSW
jgi:hypothetical protein